MRLIGVHRHGELGEIRRRAFVGGQSGRSACREFDTFWDTTQKALRHSELSGYRRAVARPKPKPGPFLPVIRQNLEADWEAPRERRHAARRIF